MRRASPKVPAPGGRCRRAASTSARILARPRCASSTSVAESPRWYTYDLPEALRPKAWGGRYRGQRQKWFAARFRGEEAEIALERPGHAPEFDSWRWAKMSELVGLIVPFKRGVYEELVRDFAPLARPEA
jgi:putative (di)nucleoside polyphosphate hydrolase